MSRENTMNVPSEFINPKQHMGYPPYNQSINFELYFYQEFINENKVNIFSNNCFYFN